MSETCFSISHSLLRQAKSTSKKHMSSSSARYLKTLQRNLYLYLTIKAPWLLHYTRRLKMQYRKNSDLENCISRIFPQIPHGPKLALTSKTKHIHPSPNRITEIPSHRNQPPQFPSDIGHPAPLKLSPDLQPRPGPASRPTYTRAP